MHHSGKIVHWPRPFGARYSANDHYELVSQIAQLTGNTSEDVARTLPRPIQGASRRDKFVTEISSTPQAEQAWYEQGPMWDKPRTPVVW